MKKFSSHITLCPSYKQNLQQKVSEKCSTPSNANKPFQPYKSPAVVSSIVQKKQLILKQAKFKVNSPRANEKRSSKSQKKSFRRKTENIEEKPGKIVEATDTLKNKLDELESRLAEIKQGYEHKKIRKSEKEAKMNKMAERSQIKDNITGKKNVSKKKISLPEKGEKQNCYSSGRLALQSPKRLNIGEDLKLKTGFKREEKQKQKAIKKPALLDYVTQYQQPLDLQLPQASSSTINLTKPQTTKNISSIGVSLRQTLAGQKSPPKRTYYISTVLNSFKSKQPSTFQQICTQHLISSFQFLSFVKKSKMAPPAKPKIHKKQKISEKKNTIIFDLDETLIHCHDNTKGKADVQLPIVFPDKNIINVFINLRPFARECLQELSKHFEIIVFTASHECYAKVIVDFLDPEHKYIAEYYSREDCYRVPEGFYVKDLRVLNRNLSNVLLVDNAAYSYCFQPENGVPIIPFYDNKADLQLKSLLPYLMNFTEQQDVRVLNNKTMKLTEYTRYRSPNDVIQSLYN